MTIPALALLVASTASIGAVAPEPSYPPPGALDLEGFASLGGGTSGGGVPEPGDVARYKVIDAATSSPAHALRSHLQGTQPVVIELRTDVDLGALDNQVRPPLVSPELIQSRLGTIAVGSNKTLFSARGATLRHGTLDLDGSRNVIVRNLRFRGLWEWDEATRGEYDRQGWDFIVLNGARNVWIDHCDFGKAYDGPLDVVRGSDLVTVSWTRFAGDLEGDVERQVAHLEALYQADAGDPRIPHYRSLRKQWSAAEIVRGEIPQQKGNLVGSADDAHATDDREAERHLSSRRLFQCPAAHAAHALRQCARLQHPGAGRHPGTLRGGADGREFHDGGRGPGREQPLRRGENAARLFQAWAPRPAWKRLAGGRTPPALRRGSSRSAGRRRAGLQSSRGISPGPNAGACRMPIAWTR